MVTVWLRFGYVLVTQKMIWLRFGYGIVGFGYDYDYGPTSPGNNLVTHHVVTFWLRCGHIV